MTTQTNPHAINWFEIPVNDIGRAQKFYETVLDMKMETMEMEGCKMAIFPAKGEASGQMVVHGALVQAAGQTPTEKGAILYFNCGDDLAPYLARVTAAGGSVEVEKSSIGEHGFYAHFKDTEGNLHGLHSPS